MSGSTVPARFSIGEAARQTGSTPANIRYFEAEGFLRHIGRLANGRRHYEQADLNIIRTIVRLRRLGFSTGHIRSIVSIIGSRQPECGPAKSYASDHLTDLRRRIRELRQIESLIAKAIDTCTPECNSSPAATCTLFDELSGAAN